MRKSANKKGTYVHGNAREYADIFDVSTANSSGEGRGRKADKGYKGTDRRTAKEDRRETETEVDFVMVFPKLLRKDRMVQIIFVFMLE